MQDTKETTDKRQIAETNRAAFKRAYDAGFAKWLATAQRCEDFFAGDQWSEEDIAEMRKTKRPNLTINLIKPTVSAILGEYINKRMSLLFKPRTNGDQQVADVLSKVAMQICDQNNFDHIERMVFTDGIITDRGYFDMRMNFDDNQQGDVRISRVDSADVIPDAQGKEYDPDTWREVFVAKWMSIDDISDIYGEEIAEQAKSQALISPLSAEYVEYSRKSTFGSNDYYAASSYNTIPSEERAVRRMRVIERQYWKVDKQEFSYDPMTGDERPFPVDWDEGKIAEFLTISGLQKVVHSQRRIRWTITAGSVVLHDDWSPYEHFTIVPYFPQFRSGRPLGIVRDLLSPQEQVNKLSSQALHVVNTTANSGWQMEEGTLINMTPDELAKNGAQTGIVLVTAPGKQVTKIQANPIPSGITQLAASASDAIKRISGVSEYMVGEGSAEVSGVALDARINRNLSQLQPVFDSLDYTRTLLAKRMVKLIQAFYTDTRMLRITSEAATGDPTYETMVVNQPTPEGTIKNDLTIGEYDVVASSQPSRATFEDTQFAQAMQMVQAGVQIPPDVLIELSSFSRKQEVAERVRQSLGMGQPTPEQQQMAQMQQEMQMQQFQLEMAKLQAQIQELQTQAMLNQAKAEQAGVTDVIGYKGTVAKERTRLSVEQGKNETKLAITRMQAEAGKLRESQAQTGRYGQSQSSTTTSDTGRNN